MMRMLVLPRRCCWILQQFNDIEYSNDEIIIAATDFVLACLRDPDLPVRVMVSVLETVVILCDFALTCLYNFHQILPVHNFHQILRVHNFHHISHVHNLIKDQTIWHHVVECGSHKACDHNFHQISHVHNFHQNSLVHNFHQISCRVR